MTENVSGYVDKMIDTCLDRLRGKHAKKVGNDDIRITTSSSTHGGVKYVEVRVILSTADNLAFARAFSQKLTALGGSELFCGPREVNSNTLAPARPFGTLQPGEWAVWFQGVPL